MRMIKILLVIAVGCLAASCVPRTGETPSALPLAVSSTDASPRESAADEPEQPEERQESSSGEMQSDREDDVPQAGPQENAGPSSGAPEAEKSSASSSVEPASEPAQAAASASAVYSLDDSTVWTSDDAAAVEALLDCINDADEYLTKVSPPTTYYRITAQVNGKSAAYRLYISGSSSRAMAMGEDRKIWNITAESTQALCRQMGL